MVIGRARGVAGRPRALSAVLRRGPGVAAVAAAVLLAPVLTPAAPAQADSDKSGVRAVTTTTAALAPGQSGWLSVVWAADLTVEDFSTTVTAPAGVTVTYPSTRGGADTSLYGSDTLVGDTTDFTAFRLSVPYTQTASFQVTLASTYSRAPGNGAGRGNPRTYTRSATVTVPIRAAERGPAYTQETTTLRIFSGSDTFQEIAFAGGPTDLADFRVRLGALPAGLEVAYPGDSTASGLNGQSTLVGGTHDFAAVRLIATDLPAGTYVIPLSISYTAATPTTATGSVTLVAS
jgi:hypothetical protein